MQAVTAPAAFWVVLGELNHTQKWHRVSHHPPRVPHATGEVFLRTFFRTIRKEGERYGKHQQQEEETSCTGGYKYITVILL